MIHFGRSDFDNIDNEALDFEQLEAFIQNNSVVQPSSSTTQPTSGDATNQITHTPNLPESPPDSGSEPPYSPNIKANQNLPMEQHMTQGNMNMNTLTELHVPHHHNLLTPSTEIFLANEHQQQLLQINNLLHGNKHDGTILPSHHHQQAPPQDHMLLYQVNQSGQIIELNHIHHQNQSIGNRMYKEGIIEMENSTGSLPAIHDMHQGLQGNINESLQMIEDNFTTQLNNQEITSGTTSNIKKRKGLLQSFVSEREGSLKAYLKPESKSAKHYGGVKSKKKHHHVQPTNEISETVTTGRKSNNNNDKKSQLSSKANEVFEENNENKNNNYIDNMTSKGNDSGSDGSQTQCIRFNVFQQQQWHSLLDHNHQELPIPHFRVDADKGFNFSNSDDAFVCQKKNHFQITCHVQLHGNGIYVKTQTGLEKVRTFHLHFYGVKLETPAQTIRIEQSQSDRSKKPFYPVLVDLQNGQVGKITVGRLHFSETTCNNMRKKGRPNPEQRYFQLVVGLNAHTYTGYYPIISHASERIIVRASNPGQFEGDVDLCCWQRGITQNSIFYQGKIGINTDMPDEYLVVNGNVKVSGHIIQPSDERVKNNICELNCKDQLENINQIRIVKYQYDQSFAGNNELDSKTYHTGIIAQELKNILPDAVHNGGNVRLANGTNIDNFLQVNKDRIFMENIGAVKQLVKITDNLEKRIENLENHHTVGFFDKIKILQLVIILMVFFTALCSSLTISR
ncbi:CLUMA_CG003248, isoform A [Clunio marinus]|uniref:CLUMA_CG003248, isoform A n=1 Tax=Clunio marinus TaxID=568069 RepID=A0A1J1HNH1_9DIPT|nr:CLUMA_CG003248, isoform A [Clunio marinus]